MPICLTAKRPVDSTKNIVVQYCTGPDVFSMVWSNDGYSFLSSSSVSVEQPRHCVPVLKEQLYFERLCQGGQLVGLCDHGRGDSEAHP